MCIDWGDAELDMSTSLYWNNILMHRDPELVKRIGAATALEVRATGIPYVFAPCIAVKDILWSPKSNYKVLDSVLHIWSCKMNALYVICYITLKFTWNLLQVCRDPRWGRCYESYSEDHQIVQDMTEIIPGLQGDIPSNSRKGVPYVGGKYELYDKFILFIFVWEGGLDAEVWAFDREIKTELHYRRLNHGRYAVQLVANLLIFLPFKRQYSMKDSLALFLQQWSNINKLNSSS